MDRRQVALLCMLDLSKVFDVIPHDRLLVKLEQYGIDVRWFTSYLSDHRQQVQIRSPDGRGAPLTVTGQPCWHLSGIRAGPPIV